MNKSERIRQISAALKENINTDARNILNEAREDTGLFNKIQQIGAAAQGWEEPGTNTRLLQRRQQRVDAAELKRNEAPGSASTQIKIQSPTQAEQVSAGMQQRNGIQTQLLMRENDFAKNALVNMGHEGVNTQFAQQVLPQFRENSNFQRDFEADTWRNRILLQDTGINQAASNIVRGFEAGQLNPDDLNTAQKNLGHAKQKQNKVNRIQNEQQQRVAEIGDNPTRGQVFFDTRFNNIRLQDTDVNNRAAQLVQAFDNGLDPKNVDTDDLGLARQAIRNRDANQEQREYERLHAAKEFLNKSNPSTPVNTQEFLKKYQESNEIFNKIKEERGVLGAGMFGAVVPGPTPNIVTKLQGPASNVWNDGSIRPNDAKQEANNLDKLRSSSFVPNVHALETMADGSTMLDMDNLAINHTTLANIMNDLPPEELQRINIMRHQQHGMAALKGVGLNDRHEGNVMINNMTHTPKQVDFGIVNDVSKTPNKAAALATETARGLHTAGLTDEGDILYDTVLGLLNDKQFDSALDVAKQGFAQLQKIKKPINAPTAAEIINRKNDLLVPF